MTPAPSETPAPTAGPDAGTPFGEGMLAFDSDEDALAYLWSLEGDEYGIMPIGEMTGKVDPKYFRFSIYSANESGDPTTYSNFSDLKTNGGPNGHTVTNESWSGPDGGDLQGKDANLITLGYPTIEGYKISSIRLNGTIIYHLGMYQVKDKTYVHFTSIDVQGRLTTVVLTKEAYDTAPFEVRYVPNEYKITYEVYLDSDKKDEGDETFGLDKIFGANRAKETVDDWASVDVTIPAGYIGQVYIGNSADLQSNDTYEKFPQEADYGNYALGAEPQYTFNNVTKTIDIVTSDAPGFYSLTGTYLVGRAGAGVTEDQTVRVVLKKKTNITFHAEAWRYYEIGGTASENKVTLSNPSGEGVDNGGWTVAKAFTDDSVDFTWTFTMNASYNDGNGNPIEDAELRTLEINGATIAVPFVSTSQLIAEKETVLPSGAHVVISANYNSGDPQYTITVTDATRDIWITGGSMNTNADAYKELIVSGLYGVNVQVWANNGSGGGWTENVQAGRTFCTGYDYGTYEAQDAYGDAGFLYHMTDPTYRANVRFQLQEGFTFAGGIERLGGTATNPTVRLVDKTGVVQSASGGVASVTELTVSEPDSDGWYYVTLPSPYGTGATPNTTMNAYLLEVRAYPEQYVVVYQDGVTDRTGNALNPTITGTVNEDSMPSYDIPAYPHVDNNSGKYYALAAGDGSYSGGDASDSITVYSGDPPTITRGTDEREVTFQGWVLTDAEGNPYKWENGDGRDGITIADKVTKDTGAKSGEYPVIQPSDLLELRNIMDASGEGFGTTGTEYAIYLTALWSTPADRYTYYVTFNYTDETGTPHERVNATVTRKEGEGTVSTTYPAQSFEVGSGYTGYYIVKRETFFNLDGLFAFLGVSGLSVAFDPENVSSISGGGLDSWQWYKYDTAKNGSGEGVSHDPYKWTGVENDGEVDVWYISTESQLTIGKTVTDLFEDEEDPADAVRETAEFTFDVQFTLPENDTGTTGNEEAYFGTGGSYSVKYTVAGTDAPEGEQTLALSGPSGGENRTYTGELKLKDGQTATFILLAGTKYTVREQAYEPVNGIGFKPSSIEITNDGNRPSSDLGSATASGEVALPGIVGGINGTRVAFTNDPSGVALVKAQAGGELDSRDGTLMHIGAGETLEYTITVYNYDEEGPITVEDEIPDADGADENTRKLRVHRTEISDGGEFSEGEAGAPGQQQDGDHYGGKVTWSDLDVDPKTSKTVTFKVSVPIVLKEETYTNSATATWGGSQSAESNKVKVTVYEDWLRIGKLATDIDGILITPEQDFDFTLTLTDESGVGTALKDSYTYVGRTALGYEDKGVEAPARGEITMEPSGTSDTKTGDFTLKAGQAITIYGIAPGIKYKVEEKNVPDDYDGSGMQPREDTVIDGDGFGTISTDSQDWVYFVNTSTMGKLNITKTVVNGPAGYGSQEFTFNVTLTQAEDSTYLETGSIPYTVGGETKTLALVEDDDGKYTGSLTLRHAQTAGILLPGGTAYTVTEATAPGYASTHTGADTGTIRERETSAVTFINTYKSYAPGGPGTVSTPGPGTTSDSDAETGPNAGAAQPSVSAVPKTADESTPALWVALAIGSALALAALAVVYCRKRRL